MNSRITVHNLSKEESDIQIQQKIMDFTPSFEEIEIFEDEATEIFAVLKYSCHELARYAIKLLAEGNLKAQFISPEISFKVGCALGMVVLLGDVPNGTSKKTIASLFDGQSVRVRINNRNAMVIFEDKSALVKALSKRITLKGRSISASIAISKVVKRTLYDTYCGAARTSFSTNEPIYKCGVCNTSGNQKSIEEHRRREHPKALHCPGCGGFFYISSNFHLHRCQQIK